ncbi:MAG: helix-turn-helix transcriptional regulator, partial [Pseudomonadota bacterium]
NIFASDEVSRQVTRVAPGTTCTSQELCVAKPVYELCGYDEFYHPNGFHQFAISMIEMQPERATWISLARKDNERPFSPRELSLLKRLNPHVRRVSDIWRRLSEARAKSDFVLDALSDQGQACAFLGARGEIVQGNAAFMSLCEKGTVRIASGKINFPEAITDSDFQSAIKRVRDPNLEDHRIDLSFQDKSGACYKIICHRFRCSSDQLDWFNRQVSALVFIEEVKAQSAEQLEAFASGYGLTQTEIKVCRLLLADYDTNDITRELQVSVNAVRFHIKNIFSKTGVRSRVSLVNLIKR